MDMTRSILERPPILVEFVPIYWEPYRQTGEKLVALIAVRPSENSDKVIRSNAYVALPYKRLLAMLGTVRGSSAYGILQQSAALLSKQLEAGLNLTDALPPFEGFSVGYVRRSSGWSVDQVLQSAVSSVSVFGSAEDMLAEEPEDARHIATTRTFISKIRSRILAEDRTLKERFNKRLQIRDSPEIVIDYGHKELLVQVTSLPTTRQQEVQLQREAESKLAELSVAIKEMGQNASQPTLLVNAEVLSWQLSAEAKKAADDLLVRFKYFADAFKANLISVESSDEGVAFLKRHV